MNSYWIWNYGDYEIYHSNIVHSRREQCGMDYPPMWRLFDVDRNVIFRAERSVASEGNVTLHLSGIGYLKIDDTMYPSGKSVAVSKGEHRFEVHVMNLTGLPAAYIESEAVATDGEWYTLSPTLERIPVGYRECYTIPSADPQIFPFETDLQHPVSSAEIDSGVLFEFERELFGYLNISGVSADDKLHVSYGESREEALDTEYSVVREDVTGQSSYKLRPRAFRYVYVCGATEPQISADYEYLPVNCVGTFRCNDEAVNRIWDMCSYTLRLNMREVLTEAIKRDRWLWSGDAYQAFKFVKYLTPETDTVRRSIIAMRGKEPVVQHINNITDYSLYWILALDEYYRNYGDIDFIRRMYPRALTLMDFCRTREDSSGFIIGKYADWVFVDWADMDKTGSVCAEQMLYIASLQTMGRLSSLVGEDPSPFTAKAEELSRKTVDRFWDEEKGAFIDSFESGKRNVTRHANIFAILYGIADERQIELIIKNVLLNDRIAMITTPYFEGYELDAMGKIGKRDYIYDMITSYWRGMLDLGATTVWEEFDPNMSGTDHYDMYGGKYMKSLCHAWGASPIYLLGKYYLGVRGTSPGEATFDVEPYLGKFGFIDGDVPVRDGKVHVYLDGNTLRVLSNVSGGTLVWQGERREIRMGEETVIEY